MNNNISQMIDLSGISPYYPTMPAQSYYNPYYPSFPSHNFPQIIPDVDRNNIDNDNGLLSKSDNKRCMRQDLFSYVRVLNASPEVPSVDVYVNERIIARGLAYRNFTPYLKLNTGLYIIRVFRSGQTTNPLINTQFQVPDNSIYTFAITGMLQNISFQPILDPVVQFVPGNALIRFIHLSPNTPSVDITLPNGQKLFEDVEYKEVTGYIPVRQGTYTLQARAAGTDNIALTVPNIRLLPNRLYSVYAVGLSGGNPPLQVLIPLDGSTYLKF
jgi:hypothetical protein